MQSKALSLAALLTMTAATACTVPVTTDSDPVAAGSSPIQSGTAASAYPEAVILDVTKAGVAQAGCTGTLVGPRTVLTSGRCATQFDGWTVTTPFTTSYGARGVGSAVYDYDQTADAPSTNEHDVGLILLDAPIELGAYPELATAPLPDGAEVVSVGRALNGEDSGSSLYVSEPVAVHGAQSAGYLYDYATTAVIEHGDDGGPDFIPGTHTLVAVNAGSVDQTALLARVDLLNSWIQEQLETAEVGGGDPGYPGYPGWPGEPGHGHGGGGEPGGGHGGGGEPGGGHGGGGEPGGGHGGGEPGHGGGGEPGHGGGGEPGGGHH